MANKSIDEPTVDMTKSMTRRMIWDVVPCFRIDDDLMELFDLIPGSEEGDEVEHRESHRRLAQMLPLVQPITYLAQMAGKVCAVSMLDNLGYDEDDPDYQERHNEILKAVIAGSRAVIANMIDAKILVPGPGNMGDL